MSRGDHCTITNPGHALPRAPRSAPGVVWRDDASHQHARQCATCLRVFTGDGIFVAHAVSFAADEIGTCKYPRCDDCRAARRHPSTPDQETPND